MNKQRILKRIIIPTVFCVAGAVGGILVMNTGPEPQTVAFGSSTGTDGPVDANIFVNLSKKVVPSVVNISTLSASKGGGMPRGTPDDLFRRFFEDFFRQHGGGRGFQGEEDEGEMEEDEGMPPPGGKGGPSRAPKAMSLGTGFIIDPSGLILTNNHVVAGADEIKIHFTEEADEKPTDGEVVGRDPELDVALIKVKTERKLTPINLGDSDTLEVGEYVIAVGNPFGQGHSVTHGIISAKGRDIPEFPMARYLQTDAPINPGNSGGPLVNLKGEVIGINNAIDQRANGIGFAIPVNAVKQILPQLRTKGTVARGYIGVLVNQLVPEIAAQIGAPKEMRAPFVTHVYPGEPADKAGLKPYDVIVEFNGKPVRSSSELIAAVTAVTVGQSVPLKINRAGKEKTVSIQVAQRPSSSLLAKAEEDKDSKKKGTKKPSRLETGMTLENLTPETARDLGVAGKLTGILVENVAYGSAADQAGIFRGDLVLEVDRKAVKTVDDFYAIVKAKKSYLVRVRRADPQGRDIFAVVVLDLKE